MGDGDWHMKTPATRAAGVCCVRAYLPAVQRAYSLLLIRPSRL
jgi:hypothetical protein